MNENKKLSPTLRKALTKIIKTATDHLDMFEPEEHDKGISWALAVDTTIDKLSRWLEEYILKHYIPKGEVGLMLNEVLDHYIPISEVEEIKRKYNILLEDKLKQYKTNTKEVQKK